jgi:hypothetical protein
MARAMFIRWLDVEAGRADVQPVRWLQQYDAIQALPEVRR